MDPVDTDMQKAPHIYRDNVILCLFDFIVSSLVVVFVSLWYAQCPLVRTEQPDCSQVSSKGIGYYQTHFWWFYCQAPLTHLTVAYLGKRWDQIERTIVGECITGCDNHSCNTFTTLHPLFIGLLSWQHSFWILWRVFLKGNLLLSETWDRNYFFNLSLEPKPTLKYHTWVNVLS